MKCILEYMLILTWICAHTSCLTVCSGVTPSTIANALVKGTKRRYSAILTRNISACANWNQAKYIHKERMAAAPSNTKVVLLLKAEQVQNYFTKCARTSGLTVCSSVSRATCANALVKGADHWCSAILTWNISTCANWNRPHWAN